eukprot:scaffold101018_cov54-Phaeocystis_antarctica.AAC.1
MAVVATEEAMATAVRAVVATARSACLARESIVHPGATALPPLVFTAVLVAARLADCTEYGVALDDLPHVLAA